MAKKDLIMSDISPEQAKDVVKAFLFYLYDKKTEKEQKQLTKAIEDNDIDKISELNESLSKFKEKYELETWMDYAANKMTNQIGFGTHISKGIHSSSKGDNVNFSPENDLREGLVGHQSINNHNLDASGNAAALPLFSFYDYEVIENKKIKDFIIENNESFKQALSKNAELSKQYFEVFRQSLIGMNLQPNTSEYNKQTLWNIGDYEYICIVPLYPSSLTNYVHKKINHIKYSEEIVTAKKNRFSKNTEVEQLPYLTISDLATERIGGSNPQGVSRHMSSQGGRNYLLPSLPPMLNIANSTFKPSKFADTIFAKSLANKVNPILQDIFYVVKSAKNTVDIRDARKEAMDEILKRIFEFANYMRNDLPAGWTKDSELDECEQFWLDPKRAELPDEEEWSTRRVQTEWHKEIIHRFARWMNTLLQEKFKDIRTEIADPEHNQWEQDIDAMKRLYERAGKGVFL